MKIFTTTAILLVNTVCIGQVKILDEVSAHFKEQNYHRAINEIRGYLEENNELDSIPLKLLHWKARSYGMLQDYDSSFYTYVDIINKFPSDRIALIQLGYRYGEARNFKMAFYFFQNLRKYYPDDPIGTQNFSFYLNELGEYKTAIVYADSTLSLAKDSLTLGSAWNNRCFSNIKLGNFAIAKEELAISLSYYPNNSYAYRNLALTLIEEGKIEDACDALEKAQQLGGIYITEQLRNQYCN